MASWYGNSYVKRCWSFSFGEIKEDQYRDILLEGGDEITITPHYGKNDSIERVTIRAKNIKLCDGAFMDLRNVREIVFQGEISSAYGYLPKGGNVNELLFSGCVQLRSISGCFSGEYLMPQVFQNCESLVSLPDIWVENLGYEPFINCKSLKRVHLHKGLKDLGCRAFKGCTALEDIYIPDSVFSLGMCTFSGCSSLRSIHLPANIRSIPCETFYGCTSLQKCFLADSIESIGEGAFAGCSSLRNPWMPKSLKRIRSGAFAECVSITEIMIPESVQEIGKDAFAGCTRLKIKGFQGSEAEKYAYENGIPFVVL